MVIQLHHIVRPIHVYLDFVFLELLELVLFQMIGKRALSAAKMATKNKELVLTGLVQKAAVD